MMLYLAITSVISYFDNNNYYYDLILPFFFVIEGWQPGVPEISAVWDEDWDKFEDEGLTFFSYIKKGLI